MNWSLGFGVARRLFVSMAIGAAILSALAGCGGGASSNPSSGAGGSPVAATAPNATPSTSASPAVPSLPVVTSSHADPALEARLPAQVSGTAMQRSSATLADLIAAGADRTAIDAFLQGIGKSESDGTYAAAFDPTNAVGGGIFVFKIVGVNATVLLPAMVSVEKADLGAGATTSQATVGGNSVTVVSVGTGVNDTEWILGRDDVVFVIHAADEVHAATFVEALP
jgi:hypothetical protein